MLQLCSPDMKKRLHAAGRLSAQQLKRYSSEVSSVHAARENRAAKRSTPVAAEVWLQRFLKIGDVR